MTTKAIRYTCFILVLSILLSTSIFATDTNTTVYTFEYENSTVRIADSELTYEQAKQISDIIVYGESNTTTYGILCLFGHKLSTTYAVETTHKEYSSSPRCVERTYRVEYCTRSSCDHSEATLISTVRVSCC